MALTITIPGGPVQLSGNPVLAQAAGASVPSGATGYKIMFKITSEDSKLTGAPFYAAVPPASGAAEIDIAGYVDQPVNALFQYPASGSKVEYNSSMFAVKVQVGERYIDTDGVLQETWGEVSDQFYILKGGVSNRQVSVWAAAATNFYITYLYNQLWLTQRPWGDFVHPLQPVKLWFISPDGFTANYKVKTYYADGTDATGAVSVTLAANKLYEFNAHPTAVSLSMTTQGGSRCTYYDVWIEGKSDSRRFEVDYKTCERPIFLYFANSLGGVDDVYMPGYITEGYKTEATEAYKPQLAADTVYDRTIIVPGKQGQNTWKLNTGIKTATQMLHLRDMLVSRQVWMLYPNAAVTAYMVIPVNISAGQIELIDRMEDLYSMEIDVQEAHASQFNFDNRLI